MTIQCQDAGAYNQVVERTRHSGGWVKADCKSKILLKL